MAENSPHTNTDLKIVRHIREYVRPSKESVGLVPTMGALHEGHAELIRIAAAECEACVVSIFVNPTQFGPNEDFERYPRMEEADFELCRKSGAKVVFCPSVDEMYPRKTTLIRVLDLSERWEGAHRPGHFDGVATVVAKLFNILQPNIAFFGEKDFQQCAVLARMVEDLDMPVALRFVPTVREADGLALSSRNAYLSTTERETAPVLYQILQASSNRIRQNENIGTVLQWGIQVLTENGFEVDYLALVDGADLRPITAFKGEARLIVAARIGKTRLIDNCAV